MPPPRRRGLVTQRAAVRRSAAKLKGLDASGSYSGALKQRGQRAAVTRAGNRLQAAQQSGRRRLQAGAQQGVIRSRQRPATGKPAVPKRLQRSEAEQAHRDKIARQIKALPKEVRRAIGVARYGKSRPGVSEYRSFLGGKKLTTHELRGHLRDAGTVAKPKGLKPGVVRPGKGPRVMNPEVMPRDRVPASQRPGSMTSTLRGLMRGLAQADARRIREVEAITGQRVTMPNTPSGAGARVRATAKGGKVADTMRAGLRELAQSDARTAREMAAIVRDATPKVAGAKGGKALRGDKKALPARKAAKSTRRRRR